GLRAEALPRHQRPERLLTPLAGLHELGQATRMLVAARDKVAVPNRPGLHSRVRAAGRTEQVVRVRALSARVEAALGPERRLALVTGPEPLVDLRAPLPPHAPVALHRGRP